MKGNQLRHMRLCFLDFGLRVCVGFLIPVLSLSLQAYNHNHFELQFPRALFIDL